jgi:putative transposase
VGGDKGDKRGYHGGKKVKGRKRDLLVETEGSVLKARVHSPKVMDHEGIKMLLEEADQACPGLCHLWVDADYRAQEKGAQTGLGRPWAGA